MFTTKAGAKRIAGRWPLAIQAALVFAVLIASLGPAPGRAALYVPLGTSAQAQGIAWARRHDSALMGPGPLPGSVIIRGQTATDVLSAAAEGALLVAVPAPLCGQGNASANNVYR